MEPKELGRRLRRYRRMADLTQKELAEQAGLHYVTISRMEHGKIKDLQLAPVVRLAKVLQISVDDLTRDPELEPTVRELVAS